jgi:predicted nucleotidyltransferase
MSSATTTVFSRRGDIEALCRRYGVVRLDLFGSAAIGADERPGDVDLLVEFQDPLSSDYAERFFGFKESLERLFGLPVDLVVGSAIRNPYFRDSVERDRLAIYAA